MGVAAGVKAIASDLESIAFSRITDSAEGLVGLSQDVLRHPETGFRETRTAGLVAGYLRAAGLAPREGVALTGVTATLEAGRPGPTVAVIGELDALVVPDHPYADQETGAAHACGHHAQLGSMLGVLAALSDDRVLSELSGRIKFIAVPAEEHIEIERREELRSQGELEHLSGKQELIRLGEFDDVDMAMLTHAGDQTIRRLGQVPSHNGVIAKSVRFLGRGAHAGGAPHLGVNALNAANIAISAMHAQRETYRDEDHIRVHPIITRGGAVVNAVPSDVTMEMFVRGATPEAIEDANRKVDRALRAGALAVGGSVEIHTSLGSMPARYDVGLADLYRSHAQRLVGPGGYVERPHRTSSTDMGDLSLLMPTIHPYAGGTEGGVHTADFLVRDYGIAVVTAAMAMAATVIDLLAGDAAKAKAIRSSFKPSMSKRAYLARIRALRSDCMFAE